MFNEKGRINIFVKKETVAWACFCTGIAIAFLGSLNAWFMWPLGGLYALPAGMFVLSALLLSNTMSEGFFNRKDFIIPTFAYILISIYILLIEATNINAHIVNFFHIIVFFALFRLDTERLPRLATFLCKMMAAILCFSIPAFLLYLIGFPLPSRDAQFNDGMYVFSNFGFFLIDDRFLLWFVPRFQSVFLEPGHLGTATVLLLMTQIGKWRKWYNILLLFATFLSFSLAAYVFLVAIVFLSFWIQRKRILSKVLLLVALIAVVVIGSFYYNQGDNMINQLIVLRLEVEDDGKLSGDNRVTEDFQAEYEEFITSSDVLFGREYDNRIAGNSGYRVFIYKYGLVGFLLFCVLYSTSMLRIRNEKRAMISTIIMTILTFWVRAYPLWYANFIPIYILAYFNNGLSKKQETTESPKEILT